MTVEQIIIDCLNKVKCSNSGFYFQENTLTLKQETGSTQFTVNQEVAIEEGTKTVFQIIFADKTEKQVNLLLLTPLAKALTSIISQWCKDNKWKLAVA